VSARDGIAQTLARYALGLDEGRDDLLADCLCDDVVLNFPALGQTVVGREDAIAYLQGRRATRSDVNEQARHVITNLYVVEEDEAQALVTSYYILVVTAAEGTRTSSGWYRDRLVRDGERWRFAERTILSDRGGASTVRVLPES